MEAVAKNKLSELGVISCCIWLIAVIFMVLFILNSNKIDGIVMGFLSLFLQICAFILGIIGLFQKDRKKTFPILGIVLSTWGLGPTTCFVTSLFIGWVVEHY